MNVQRNQEVLTATDCGFLSILDTSFYPVPVDSATISIGVPGYDYPFQFVFTLGEVNIFNSYSFGFTTSITGDFSSIPDGVYEFNITTCPDTGSSQKFHLRTCNINCRLAVQWAKYPECCEDEKIAYYLDKIEFLLKGAEANAELCNVAKATELYRKADDLLRRLESDC